MWDEVAISTGVLKCRRGAERELWNRLECKELYYFALKLLKHA